MQYQARITAGRRAAAGALCDLVHLDERGDLLDQPATSYLMLLTSIGERFVHVCDGHDEAVGSDLARWSHPVNPLQSLVEAGIDGMLSRALTESVPHA